MRTTLFKHANTASRRVLDTRNGTLDNIYSTLFW